MNGWMDVWMYGWDEWMGWIDVKLDGWWMNVLLNGWMEGIHGTYGRMN